MSKQADLGLCCPHMPEDTFAHGAARITEKCTIENDLHYTPYISLLFQPNYAEIEIIKVVRTYGPIPLLSSQLAFYVNLHRAVIGPSATLTGR